MLAIFDFLFWTCKVLKHPGQLFYLVHLIFRHLTLVLLHFAFHRILSRVVIGLMTQGTLGWDTTRCVYLLGVTFAVTLPWTVGLAVILTVPRGERSLESFAFQISHSKFKLKIWVQACLKPRRANFKNWTMSRCFDAARFPGLQSHLNYPDLEGGASLWNARNM